MSTISVRLSEKLELERCPHCSIHRPNLQKHWEAITDNHSSTHPRLWRVYVCGSCGGLIAAAAPRDKQALATEIFPQPRTTPETIPDPARAFLAQAFECLHAPSGAIMLCASAVDAMLKAKGLVKGSLFDRIDKAAADHLITAEMGAWAHDVRLDANDQRHADKAAQLPSTADAQKCLDFVSALAEFLFVLPERVERGRKQAGGVG